MLKHLSDEQWFNSKIEFSGFSLKYQCFLMLPQLESSLYFGSALSIFDYYFQSNYIELQFDGYLPNYPSLNLSTVLIV